MSAADTVLRYVTAEGDRECVIDRLAICRIGRGPDNMIVIDDHAASREHAMIRRNASGECVLTDLGSTNGTRLDGRLLTSPAVLSDGSMIQIGRQIFHFYQVETHIDLAKPQAAPETMFYIEQSLITTLVVDVRGYTPLARELGEERVSALMGEIFKQAGAALHARGCWTVKFIGDAIMAVWTHADPKVKPADLIGIFDAISEIAAIFAEQRKRFSLTHPMRFGCGINSGQASVGNLGSALNADFTALGDAVNKAFRLEAATRTNDCDILLGADVLAYLDADLGSSLGAPQPLALKGYDAPVEAVAIDFNQLGAITATLLSEHDRHVTKTRLF